MPLTAAEQARYGSLGAVVAFGGIPLYLYAPDFYGTAQGISLAGIGSALLILRLVDAATDPLWGWLADRWVAHRKTLYLGFALAFLLGLYALFAPPESAGLGWFAMTVFLASAGYSFLTILLNAMASIRAESRQQAVRLTTVREGFVLLGLMLAALVPPLMTGWLGVRTGYASFAAVLVLFSLPLLWVWFGWLGQQPNQQRSTHLQGFLPAFRAASSTYSIYSLSALASACPAVLFVFFVRDYLELSSLTGLFLFAYFAAGVAGMPIWRGLADRLGLEMTWLIAMVAAIFSFSLVLFADSGDLWLFLLVCLGSGLAFGGDLALPTARLVGQLSAANLRTESSQAFALLAFISKLVLAVSAALLFWMLDQVEFTPAGANDERQRFFLLVGYAAIPLVLKILAAILLIPHIRQPETLAHESRHVNQVGNHLDISHDR